MAHLKQHNSLQDDLPIAVIGAGIAGLSVAYYLCKAQRCVHIYHHQQSGTMSASEAAQGVATLKGISLARSGVFHGKMRGFWALKELLSELSSHSLSCKDISPASSLWHQGGVIEPFQTLKDYRLQAQRTYQRAPQGFFTKDFLSYHHSDSNNSRLLREKLSEGMFPYAYVYPQGFVYSPKRLLESLKAFVLTHKNNRFFHHHALPVYKGSCWHIAHRSYSHVVLCVGDALPTTLKQLKLRFSVKSSMSYGRVFSWLAPDCRNTLLAALNIDNPVQSNMFAWKQGARSCRGEVIDSSCVKYAFGSFNTKVASSLSSQGCPYCLTAKRPLSIKQSYFTGNGTESGVKDQVCQECQKAIRQFYQASHKMSLREGRAGFLKAQALWMHSARRLTLREGKPVMGALWQNEHSRVAKKYASMWLFGGLDKTGYFFAAYFGKMLVSSLLGRQPLKEVSHPGLLASADVVEPL
ncbi:MAG: FAD-dependent oxidoreductase [Proteobacteria bacterium]|nr:FAD-dependent oxidoreductase [Pseudomonadota bacterium]